MCANPENSVARPRWPYWSFCWFWEAIMDDSGHKSIEIAAFDWSKKRVV